VLAGAVGPIMGRRAGQLAGTPLDEPLRLLHLQQQRQLGTSMGMTMGALGPGTMPGISMGTGPGMGMGTVPGMGMGTVPGMSMGTSMNMTMGNGMDMSMGPGMSMMSMSSGGMGAAATAAAAAATAAAIAAATGVGLGAGAGTGAAAAAWGPSRPRSRRGSPCPPPAHPSAPRPSVQGSPLRTSSGTPRAFQGLFQAPSPAPSQAVYQRACWGAYRAFQGSLGRGCLGWGPLEWWDSREQGG